MSKTIEEMIKSGCTYEEAMDALQNIWESAVAEREYNTKEAEARQTIMADYKKYLQIICPTISEKHLEKQVDELESTLITIREIYHKFTKNNEPQLKSKEETNKTNKTVDDFADWVEKLFNKIDAERKDAESADKARPEKSSSSLDDFLKKMGW